MTSIKNQIDKLLKSSNNRIGGIKNIISKSISDNKIHDELDLEFKSFLEELRSALDYCANDIYKKYSKGELSKIYFPIKSKEKTLCAGRNKKFWESLKNSNIKLYDYLENIQNTLEKNYKWLQEFNDLVNESKHRNFTIKWLNRSERRKIESETGKIDWDIEKVKFSGKITTSSKPTNYIVGTIFIGDMMPIRFFCELCYKKISYIIDEIYKLL